MPRPQLSFTIEDLGDPHEYEYIIYLRQSIPPGWTEEDWETDEEVAALVGQRTSPGQVTATWNGSQTPGGDPDTMPAGVYSFDIFVREYDDVDDPERELLDETATAADGNEYGLPRCSTSGGIEFSYLLAHARTTSRPHEISPARPQGSGRPPEVTSPAP